MDDVWPASRFFSDSCSSMHEKSVFEGPSLRHFQQQQQEQQSLQQMFEILHSTNQQFHTTSQPQQRHQHQQQHLHHHIVPSYQPHQSFDSSFSSHPTPDCGSSFPHMLPASSEISTFPLAQSQQIMPGLEPSGLNSSGRFDSSGRFSTSVGYDPSDRLDSSGRFELTSRVLDSSVEHDIAGLDSFQGSMVPSDMALPPLHGPHEAAMPKSGDVLMVDIQDFCWVNEDYCVRVFVPFPGVEALPASCITSTFTKDSLCLLIRGLEGACYCLALDSLYGEIEPSLCSHSVHKDKAEVILAKVTSGPSDGPETDIFTWFSLRL